MWAPRGVFGSGGNDYFFSGSWWALVIILEDLGSKLVDLGIYGAQPKSKKINLKDLTLKEKPSFCLIKNFFGFSGCPPEPPNKM